MDKNVPLIGVITARAAESEQKQQLRGIIKYAREVGADVAVLSNIYNSEKYYAEVEVENRIYDLIMCSKFDGFILSAESILNPEIQQQIYNYLMSRPETPVVAVAAEIPGMDCVVDDVESDIFELTEHLITVHGFTDIDLLTGFDAMPTSHQRVEGYRRALESHGIHFDEKKVIYGDFWNTSGKQLAIDYISGKRKMPQATACTNDYMAFGLCDALVNGGVRIPEDITVVGYEYIGERFMHAPVLTTYLRNREDMGAIAFVKLYNKITGSELPLPELKGRLIAGSSCKCGTDMRIFSKELEKIRRDQYYSQLNLVGNFEQQLTTCRSIDDYITVLKEFVYLIRDLKGLYLCLHDNWCSSEKIGSDLMICHTIMRPDGIELPQVCFRESELYPSSAVYRSSDQLILYCAPIFFSGRSFGYFILQYTDADSYDIIFRDWLKIASNALEYLRLKNDMDTLLECIDLSSNHDSVTGLYNEEGIKTELEYAAAASPDSTVDVIMIRNNVFSGGLSLDLKKADIARAKETARILEQNSSGLSFSGRISENQFIKATVGRSELSLEETADRIYTQVLHTALEGGSSMAEFPIIAVTSKPAAELVFDDISSSLMERINQEVRKYAEMRTEPNFSRYEEMRTMIYREPQQEYSVDNIARLMNHSKAYFRSTYKEFFGISFQQDIIRSRMYLAKYLLLTTQLSLGAISQRCGYDDEKYFFRRFKAETGMTPNRYRAV